MTTLRCKNCAKRTKTYPRGLCRRCYLTPAVRAAFPSRRGERSAGACGSNVTPAPPPAATAARPGSEEKVLVLQERVSRGWQLWHPQDAEALG